MERASPADLRTAIEAANALMCAGIMFVPMPIISAADAEELKAKAYARLEAMEREAESDEA